MITRRELLGGLVLAGGMSLLPFGRRAWALQGRDVAAKHLVVVLMRGAVDGLSIVAPYMEPDYYRKRPMIALPPPGQADGLLPLDGFFGLHPALAPLVPFWQDRTLAFVQASGSPSPTRSHFEAQDVLETALLNAGAASQGWMNGLAQALPPSASATRALSFGNRLPRIFQGPFNVATVPNNVGRLARKGQSGDTPQARAEFSALYAGHPELAALYQEGMSARDTLSQDMAEDITQNGAAPNGTFNAAMQREMVASAKDAPPPDAFVREATQAAALIRRDANTQLVFLDVGGWDTHVGQGNAKGQLANRLARLGEGLAALARGLGPVYRDTAILVLSEFGRTVAQNGNNGTDHGHGNVAWLMGGAVRGGKVWGRWPGLGAAQLYEGRDLAVTTDFRAIIGAAVAGQFGLDDAQMQRVVPGYREDAGLRGLVG